MPQSSQLATSSKNTMPPPTDSPPPFSMRAPASWLRPLEVKILQTLVQPSILTALCSPPSSTSSAASPTRMVTRSVVSQAPGTPETAPLPAGTVPVLRIAGGWCRDRLLGRHSLDIDIAIDCTSGKAYAVAMQNAGALAKVATIAANPAQSKHLETARIRIAGIWIDLVNLRAESYASDAAHRIPEARYGTPREDALRRDLTINALFFNLTTGEFEDATGQGIPDLVDRVLRTPRPPRETFIDDPLRVLRVARFAARLPTFQLHPELYGAARDPTVRDALARKVSRERIGLELEGLCAAVDPLRGLTALADWNVLGVVLCGPGSGLDGDDGDARITREVPLSVRRAKTFTDVIAWRRERGTAVAGLPALADETERPVAIDEQFVPTLPGVTVPRTPDQDPLLRSHRERVGFVGALLSPHFGVEVTLRKGKTMEFSQHVLREGLKWPVRDSAALASLAVAVPTFVDVLRADKQLDRLETGRLLLRVHDLWRTALWVATAVLATEETTDEGRAEVLRRCEATELHIATSLSMDECWEWPPLIDGTSLVTELALPKGPIVGRLLSAITDARFSQPDLTRDQALQHARQVRDADPSLKKRRV